MNPASQRNHTVLFIDDEIEIIEIYRQIFEEHFHMVTAASALEGLESLDQNEISVVVTDMRMPQMDGAQFLDIANHKHRKPIKIILSAYVQDFFDDSFQRDLRPYAIVRKPIYQIQDFLTIILEAIQEYDFRYGHTGSDLTSEPIPPDPGFLNAQEILECLRISKPTLYKYLKEGLPSKRLGGRRLFDWEEVKVWIDQNRKPFEGRKP